MNYTESQKEIVRGLSEGKFSNIWEYLISITHPKERKFQTEWNESDFIWHIHFSDKTY